MELCNVSLTASQVDIVMRGGFIMVVDGNLYTESEWEDFVSIPRRLFSVASYVWREKDGKWQWVDWVEWESTMPTLIPWIDGPNQPRS